jgi:hypothetical protein
MLRETPGQSMDADECPAVGQAVKPRSAASIVMSNARDHVCLRQSQAR